MSLICLIFIGALIGWMAAILTRVEDVPGIRRDLALGVAGALVVGLVANNGVMLGGLTWISLLAGIGGGALAPVAYRMIQKRRSA
ncbi:MAG: GlsB/YeaQ/YmgE family stress response membrane protein [Erythrobacter sp.]